MRDSVWQLCPKCSGTKISYDYGLTGGIQCDICNGTGLISMINGLPPVQSVTTTANSTETTEEDE